MEGDRRRVYVPTALRISIHALRVEGDITLRGDVQARQRFLSTPSGWRATAQVIVVEAPRVISIHALRVEGDGLYGGFYK